MIDMDYIIINGKTIYVNVDNDFLNYGDENSLNCDTVKLYEEQQEWRNTFLYKGKILCWEDLEFALYENLTEAQVGWIMRVLLNTSLSKGACAVFAFRRRYIFIYAQPRNWSFKSKIQLKCYADS